MRGFSETGLDTESHFEKSDDEVKLASPSIRFLSLSPSAPLSPSLPLFPRRAPASTVQAHDDPTNQIQIQPQSKPLQPPSSPNVESPSLVRVDTIVFVLERWWSSEAKVSLGVLAKELILLGVLIHHEGLVNLDV